MTESPTPDWDWTKDAEAAWSLAHEPAKCGHARANCKDPKFGTPEYEGNEKCEFCAALVIKDEEIKQLKNSTPTQWAYKAVCAARTRWQTLAETAETALEGKQQEIERLTELANKYKFQVRDTCKRAEAAEAKLAEATKYAVSLHMMVTDAQAHNLELVGALDKSLEVMEFAYMNAPEQPKEIEIARAALSRANTEQWRELLESADALDDAQCQYRKSHDLRGSGDINTGGWWDKMRHAGDKYRAIRAALHSSTGERT